MNMEKGVLYRVHGIEQYLFALSTHYVSQERSWCEGQSKSQSYRQLLEPLPVRVRWTTLRSLSSSSKHPISNPWESFVSLLPWLLLLIFRSPQSPNYAPLLLLPSFSVICTSCLCGTEILIHPSAPQSPAKLQDGKSTSLLDGKLRKGEL